MNRRSYAWWLTTIASPPLQRVCCPSRLWWSSEVLWMTVGGESGVCMRVPKLGKAVQASHVIRRKVHLL